MNNDQIIEKYIDEAVKKTASEFKRQGLLKDNKQTPFQKTETVLYNYNNFKDAVNAKLLEIETIQACGVQKKSNSVTSFVSGGSYEVKADSEKAEEKIEAIMKAMQKTQNFIKVIDDAVSSLSDDPYYNLIRMKYFEGVSRENIAEYFEVDASTISRHKNRLINMLQIKFFSDEVIDQIYA